MIRRARLGQVMLWVVFLCLWPGRFVPAALAHDGPPRLILNTFQFAPGQALELSGANLGTDLALRVELVASNRVVALGQVVCDGHGDFTQTFALPADLSAGLYTVQAVDTSVAGVELVLASAPLRVSGEQRPNQPETQTFGSVGVAAIAPAAVGSALIGLAVLAIALFMVLSVRRRRPADQRAVAHQPGSHRE